jgi:hypothetical protein
MARNQPVGTGLLNVSVDGCTYVPDVTLPSTSASCCPGFLFGVVAPAQLFALPAHDAGIDRGWSRWWARLSGTGRKTVRRYVDRARACGLDRDGGDGQLTDELIAAVIAGVRPSRPTGKSLPWETIAAEHEQIRAWLKDGLTLTKVHTLLGRRGVVVSYRTLHRYATTELDFGCRQSTVPVADCEREPRCRSPSGGSECSRRQRWAAPGGSRVDLHRGVLAVHVRLAHLPPDAG